MGMQLNPYLMLNGQCEAAFRFYKQALGGKIVATMTFGDSPIAEQTPAELRG
jgi:PhnB protein